MSNPGFNIKVREVENGFTIHVTRVSGTEDSDDHLDYIAEASEIKTKLTSICGDEVDELRATSEPRQS